MRFALIGFLAVIGPCVLGAQPGCPAFTSRTVKIQKEGTGAGVVLRSDGQTAWIATAKHVVQGPGNILVWFAGGARSYPATIEYPSSESLGTLDVAVLKVSATAGSIPKLSTAAFRSGSLQLGEHVSFVGHPAGASWQCYMNKDVVSRLSYSEDDRLFLFSNPTTKEGVSGGPVFDQQGNLIGLISAESRSKDSIAVRIGSVLRIMSDELKVELGQPDPQSVPTRAGLDSNGTDGSGSRPLRAVDTVKFFTRGDGIQHLYELYKCQNDREVITCSVKITRLAAGNGDYKYGSTTPMYVSKLIDNFNVEHKLVGGYFVNGRGQRQEATNLGKDDGVLMVQEFDGASSDIKSARIVFTQMSVQLRGPVQ